MYIFLQPPPPVGDRKIHQKGTLVRILSHSEDVCRVIVINNICCVYICIYYMNFFFLVLIIIFVYTIYLCICVFKTLKKEKKKAVEMVERHIRTSD